MVSDRQHPHEPPRVDVRTSDAERAAVAAQLTTAVGEGRIDLEIYSARTAAAYAATTRGELAMLTADLPEAPAPAAARVADPGAGAGASGIDEVEELTAVLGNESRKGRWTVPRRVVARSVLGDCHIDLKHARLTHPVTTIELSVLLGAATVLVPPGVAVRMYGGAVAGARSCRLPEPTTPDAPVIEIVCRVRFGSVAVVPSR